MSVLAPKFATRSPQVTAALQYVAFLTFAAYVTLLLGTSSVARNGGPLAWFPVWRLPDATGEWVAIGIVTLLPVLSAVAWLLARATSRRLITLTWGWKRIAWPLAALALLGLLRTLLPCLSERCSLTAVLRLLLIVAHLGWVYLYVVNEKPPLLGIISAIILIQSTVAVGQFIGQGDFGLTLLGEFRLDPEISGVSVVMRGAERWLRAYGLTSHPNILAGTLVTLLLMLPIVGRQLSPRRRLIGGYIFSIGFGALLMTLARWASMCLALGLGINALPWFGDGLSRGRWSRPAIDLKIPATVLLILVLFLSLYGDAVTGRVTALDTPVESRSLSERERDTEISIRVIAANPLAGVGVGNYVPAALKYEADAEIVHVVPLLLGAELGIGGIAVWLWLVVAPLLRRDALGRFAPETGLWLSFWLLGMLYPAPHPLYELRSALSAGLVAGLLTQSSDVANSSKESK